MPHYFLFDSDVNLALFGLDLELFGLSIPKLKQLKNLALFKIFIYPFLPFFCQSQFILTDYQIIQNI